MRISDWSSDVCSSDLTAIFVGLDMGTLVAFDPQFLQTDMLQIGHDTHRHADMAEFLGRDLAVLALDLRGYAFASRRHLLNTVCRLALHALCVERLPTEFAAVGLFDRPNSSKHARK